MIQILARLAIFTATRFDTSMRNRPRARAASGTVDFVLILVLAGLAIMFGWISLQPLGILVDLAACLAAALAVRWPRAAGIALGVILAVYAFAPHKWGQMGQYAPLIAILGAGIRDDRRTRMAMAIGYWVIYLGIQLNLYPAGWVPVFAALTWAALIAMAWAVGNAFSAYRNAQSELRAAALTQQRLSLARDLHDSLSRTLVRLSLQARAAAADNDPTALGEIADGIGHASSELRWLLSALREPDADTPIHSSGSLATRMNELIDQLDKRGFPVTVTIDGDLEQVPSAIGEVVASVASEAAANVERHGAKGRPCSLLASLDTASLDLAVINEVAAHPSTASANSMGLLGAAERLAAVGGTIESRAEGSRWITRVTVPLAVG
jgi:Signal transduction histidine kinase